MDQNRSHSTLPGALDEAIFSSFGENDSVVDRLLSMPANPRDGLASSGAWDKAIARRAEMLIAERMRKTLGGKSGPRGSES